VTFVTAMQYLETAGLSPGGHMAVAMVLMESPAIIMAVLLANALRHAQVTGPATVPAFEGAAVAVDAGPGIPAIGKILHEPFTDGAHLLLLGSMAVDSSAGRLERQSCSRSRVISSRACSRSSCSTWA
jgi:hypothetical protein